MSNVSRANAAAEKRLACEISSGRSCSDAQVVKRLVEYTVGSAKSVANEGIPVRRQS